MQTAARKSTQNLATNQNNLRSAYLPQDDAPEVTRSSMSDGLAGSPGILAGIPAAKPKTRVFLAAENRLINEALFKMLARFDDLEVIGTRSPFLFGPEILWDERADILLLSSQGNLSNDLQLIRKVRTVAPDVQILLMGMSGDEVEFLQCVRSGARGYLLRDASTEDVLAGLRALSAGEVVCPGALCGLLFRYFEREACSLPSATIHHRLGLTRREQQLIPLIAEGRTNKEIANHFCLSEQTVKNHLYRMKHKVGAGDRLGIVQVCRTQGFLV